MENASTAEEVLNRLRRLGVSLQIDDFGTGYSSLAYLQRYPIDTIKIDRTFVSRLGSTSSQPHTDRFLASGGNDLEIVRTIIRLANELGMETVAEGVETHEQYHILKQLNCRFVQGFLIARPMEPLKVTGWLTDVRREAYDSP
jgi:EAL domain-containing protein (putative c-di-GMP-specific phosphodiesterase class I)